MVPSLVAAAVLVLAAASGGAAAQVAPAPAGDHPVTARLVLGETGWRPGRANLVGVHLRIREGWHVYWKGQNDSGLPVLVRPGLPDGWSTDALLWPPPERHVWGGEFLDHVHEDEVVLLLPVHVPADATPGQEATLQAELEWLVCEDACIPGGAEVSLTLPVLSPDAPPAPSPHEELVAAAVRALPAGPPPELHCEWQGDELRLRLPGAAGLSFAPEEGSLPLAALAASGEAQGEELVLRKDPALQGGARVVGVLAVRRSDGARSHHALDLPGPPAPR